MDADQNLTEVGFTRNLSWTKPSAKQWQTDLSVHLHRGWDWSDTHHLLWRWGGEEVYNYHYTGMHTHTSITVILAGAITPSRYIFNWNQQPSLHAVEITITTFTRLKLQSRPCFMRLKLHSRPCFTRLKLHSQSSHGWSYMHRLFIIFH